MWTASVIQHKLLQEHLEFPITVPTALTITMDTIKALLPQSEGLLPKWLLLVNTPIIPPIIPPVLTSNPTGLSNSSSQLPPIVQHLTLHSTRLRRRLSQDQVQICRNSTHGHGFRLPNINLARNASLRPHLRHLDLSLCYRTLLCRV